MKITHAKKVEEKKKKEEASQTQEVTDSEDTWEEENKTDYKTYFKPALIVGAVLLIGIIGYFMVKNGNQIFGDKETGETAVLNEVLVDSLLMAAPQGQVEVEESGDPAIAAFRGLLAGDSFANG